MKENNVIVDKSFDFAVRIVNLYKYIVAEKHEFILSKQLVRSATSVGANVEEAIGGISKADFNAKIGISYRQARETRYWLKLLYATDYLNEREFNSLMVDVEEILKILGSILKTSKANTK
jgi:four helix bundle protein